MGKIYYLLGKSASGKDSIYSELLKRCPELKRVVLYTTRPMRENEQEGVQYHFINEDKYREFKEKGLIIESRDYNTIAGVWSYMTVKDGQIDLDNGSYLMIGTLESYEKMIPAYGEDKLVPIYIYVEDGERLLRAIAREREQRTPRYAEMCRRFLADEADFAPENLERNHIERAYVNNDFETVVSEIIDTIQEKRI